MSVLTGDFRFIGALAPVATSLAVLAVMCWMNDWLYRRGIFIEV